MALTNNLKMQVDLPVWEWLRFLPAASAAAHTMTTGEGLNERYMYYASLTNLWRYDTYSDSWQQLATPPVVPATVASLRYTTYGGNWGRALAAGASSITLPGLNGQLYVGQKIRIMFGTGQGQERTITAAADPVIFDQGIVTTATATQLTDSTKKWDFNQWQGYYVAVEHNTGVTQHKKVIYNDATNLYFNDANYQAIDHWNNTGFSAQAPYAAPVATAGSQAHYVIKSQVCTVDSPWTVQPDANSRYCVMSGALWLASSAAGVFFNLQYYDVLTDTWLTKSAVGGLILAAIGTDISIERIGEYGGTFLTGTASAGGARTLTDSGKSMTVDRYANFQIRITGGTGIGQRRMILANSATVFEVERPWDTAPDNTSTYSVYGDSDKIYLAGNGASAMYQYSVFNDMWGQGKHFDYGLTRQLSAKVGNYEAIGLTSITRNTGGITAVNATPTAGGSGYVVGDILTISTGGTAGKVEVTATSAGVVTAVKLYACGSGYTTGTGKATTGGTGTSCTVEISTVGTVGRVVTAINHFFKIGDSVTIAGAAESAWNAATSILGVDSLTAFDIAATAIATAAAANSLSTTLVVDTTKNWNTNEHVGRLVQVSAAGPAGAGQTRRITANTATTLTLQSAITAPTNGASRYLIHDVQCFGRDRQYKNPALGNSGAATGGSTTTLVDSTKTWKDNQWANYRIRITAGTGIGNEFAITSNTGTTLTYSTQSFTPDSSTRYIIMDTFGVSNGTNATTGLQDTTKNWTVNQWAGKRVRITSGTGQGNEYTITSNTANSLVWGAATAPDTNSTYQILGIPVRGSGIELQWLPGQSDAAIKGRILVSGRGSASNTLDKYDIPSELWEYGIQLSPQSETLTTGTMFAYDGVDTIYIQKDATGRVYAWNVLTGKVNIAGMIPYNMSTASIGNRMEIIQTTDGLKYLYIVRHAGQEFWRTLLFW